MLEEMLEDFKNDLQKGCFSVEANKYNLTRKGIQVNIQTFDTLVYAKTQEILTEYNNFSSNYQVNIWEDTPQPYENFIVCTTYANNKPIAWFIWSDVSTYFAVPVIRRLGKNILIDACFIMDHPFQFTTYRDMVHQRHQSRIQSLHDSLSFVMSMNHMLTDRRTVTRKKNPGHNLGSPKTSLKTLKPRKNYVRLVRSVGTGVRVTGRGGPGVPKRPHRRRGHWRRLTMGSKIFINPVDVNNPTGSTYFLRA
jgi:hypothetical protein